MSDLVKEMTAGCQREDCELVSDNFGISNSAGSGTGWTCRSCKRRWSVWHPTTWEQTTYDKHGNAKHPEPQEPRVTEIKPR